MKSAINKDLIVSHIVSLQQLTSLIYVMAKKKRLIDWNSAPISLINVHDEIVPVFIVVIPHFNQEAVFQLV